MIRLRSEQVDAQSDSQRQNYIERMVRHLEITFPEAVWVMDPDARLAFVDRGIAHAAAFGLTREDIVSRFLEYRCMWGEDLGRAPFRAWMLEVLSNEVISEREKIDQVDVGTYGVPTLTPEGVTVHGVV